MEHVLPVAPGTQAPCTSLEPVIGLRLPTWGVVAVVRAAVVEAYGQEKAEIRDDVEAIAPAPGHVKVRMRSTGVCHSDMSAMAGILPAALPAVLGHEGAGDVLEVGEGVTRVKPGDRVIVAWVPPCGTCRTC